jgi:hypothetical protein
MQTSAADDDLHSNDDETPSFLCVLSALREAWWCFHICKISLRYVYSR